MENQWMFGNIINCLEKCCVLDALLLRSWKQACRCFCEDDDSVRVWFVLNVCGISLPQNQMLNYSSLWNLLMPCQRETKNTAETICKRRRSSHRKMGSIMLLVLCAIELTQFLLIIRHRWLTTLLIFCIWWLNSPYWLKMQMFQISLPFFFQWGELVPKMELR